MPRMKGGEIEPLLSRYTRPVLVLFLLRFARMLMLLWWDASIAGLNWEVVAP